MTDERREIPKSYNAADSEDSIYQQWIESGFFNPDALPGKRTEQFSIMMPPPNATGTLHLGHAMMLAVQDTVIRYQRMMGKKALWLPGTDHAAIATHAKVERRLLETEGKTRQQLGREEFLKRVNEFVADSQATIKNQVRKMGSSCDWSRERYTLDEGLNRAVTDAFVQMYHDGLIYRGNRIVNWCPHCMSTLADDEVEYIAEKTPFYYFKYGPVVIGTARPETKFGDKVIIVHPDDERYKDLVGKEMEVEWILGPIMAKVIADPVADKELGSGAMTITPGHSFVDFELAQKYGLEIKKIIDEQGRLTEEAGEYAGMNVRQARSAVVEALQKKGLVDRIDDQYEHNLSVCYRCGTPVEPLPSRQWFVDVNKPTSKLGGKSLKQRAVETVRGGEITIIPERFNKVYFNWMDNLRDWCISRQIWFGHRIPVWYRDEDIYVGHEAPAEEGWRQDEDTLDTWFSSGLWTFSTLGWPNQTEDLKTFHPTSFMETGYDIIFFWVARMIIMTTYLTGQIPFETVYLHGLVRDEKGRKMSKSLDNIIDPLDMIAKYGGDATRLSLLVGTTPGNDTNLSEEKIAGYRNFTNKLWNISRYIQLTVNPVALQGAADTVPTPKTPADQWVLQEYTKTLQKYHRLVSSYQLSLAAEELYHFTYDIVADWYLEVAKIEKEKDALLAFLLQNLLKLWHPFMPFVTEAIWKSCGNVDLIMIEPLPVEKAPGIMGRIVARLHGTTEGATVFSTVMDVVGKIRNVRAETGVPAGAEISAVIIGPTATTLETQRDIIMKLARLQELILKPHGEAPAQSASAVASGLQIYLPLSGMIDIEKEKARLAAEVEQLEKYIATQKNKLANDQFVANAPRDIVAHEKEKLTVAQTKHETLRQQLNNLS